MKPTQPAVSESPVFDTNRFDWRVEVRGGFIAFAASHKKKPIYFRKKRSAIRSFSRRSRLRMFKKICQIEWAKTRKGIFVTLTFPDEVWPLVSRQRLRMLSEWFRRVEELLGRKVSALWRCEWEERQTGMYRGEFLPHFHLLIFDVPFLAWQKARRFWREIIGYRGSKKLRTEVKRMGTATAQRVYIAKYCAKLPPSLVSGSYCRMDGQHWGYYRHALLPLGERWLFEDVSPVTVDYMRDLASCYLRGYDPMQDAGGCFMFRFGTDLKVGVLKFLLDNETPNG